MKSTYKFYVLLVLSFYLISSVSFAQQADIAPLGFELGISEKDAKRIIDSKGKRIMEDNVDSKKMRTIIMQGIIVDLPIETDGKDVRTGLEFYDKKLLSNSLIFISEDSFEQSRLKDELIDYITENYGEHVDEDTMMHFHTWTWHTEDMKMVLHTNSQDNSLKVEYTYKPVHEQKYEAELDVQRGTEKKDPARQMFLDGDYSKPTGYDDKYNVE